VIGTPPPSCTPAPTVSGGLAASPAATPTVVVGRLVLTEAASGQSFTVPPGTIVEVDLTTRSFGPWRVPDSSDPTHLPRLSGYAACDGTATATFRATGSGTITAVHGNQEVTERFTVSIIVAP
jgi:hypothetical protein